MNKLPEMPIRAKYSTLDSNGEYIQPALSLAESKYNSTIIINDSNIEDLSKYFDYAYETEYNTMELKQKPEYLSTWIKLQISGTGIKAWSKNEYHIDAILISGLLYMPLVGEYGTFFSAMNVDDGGPITIGNGLVRIGVVLQLNGTTPTTIQVGFGIITANLDF